MTLEANVRAASRIVQDNAATLEEATQQRDNLIRQAHADRVPLRTIADWAGISFGRVAQIVRR